MIVDKINEYLSSSELVLDDAIKYEIEKIAGYTFKRQFMEVSEYDSTGRLYVSQVGKCPRQLAYQFHGFEKSGKDIDGRARLIFWFGDLVETAIVSIAKLSGCNITATGLNQMHLVAENEKFKLSGYPDGLVLTNKELVVLEIKSMSDFAFKRFEKGEVDESYIAQVNMEMELSGTDKCCFVGLNKNNCIMNEMVFERDQNVIDEIKSNLFTVVNSTPEKLPAQKYSANEKGKYPWQCLYCSYWKHCRPNAEKVLQGKSYILKEKQNG